MKTNLKKLMVLAPIAAMALFARTGHAVTIAIVDSGTDILHKEIANRIWDNPGEIDDGVDNDDNGYIDDLHGWNFVDNNNHLVNRKLIGTFPADVYTFFEVQTRMLKGTATDADRTWWNSHKGDQAFIAKLEAFGNFVHGTHVAGISAKNANLARLMPLKFIGSPTPIGAGSYHGLSVGIFNRYVSEHMQSGSTDAIRDKVIRAALDYLASAQGQGINPEAEYIHMEHAKVANCSFGSSATELKPLLKQLIETVWGRPLTDQQLNDYTKYFMGKVVDSMEKYFINVSPETLFVIAAGNDGVNNDEMPAAPANVRTENSITVAATLDRSKIASFSNYGEVSVDIGAPGVGILSTIPGDQHLLLSGTSQATPYITNLAGRILDTNPKLSISEAKLILMETVDKKDFLTHKVKSGGIANGTRALAAARLSLTMSISDAIYRANHEVSDIEDVGTMSAIDDSDIYVTKLPSVLF